MLTFFPIDDRGLLPWQKRVGAALERSVTQAGASALRKMRAEANRLVRERKAMKLAAISKLVVLSYPSSGGANRVWKMRVKAERTPVAAYPHRQVARGVSAQITAGRQSLIAHAFTATVGSGHRGVWLRHGPYRPAARGRYAGKMRQAIRELYTTRLVDVFEDPGFKERLFAVASEEFKRTFTRVFAVNKGRLGR
jgi:hypothetical protein